MAFLSGYRSYLPATRAALFPVQRLQERERELLGLGLEPEGPGLWDYAKGAGLGTLDVLDRALGLSYRWLPGAIHAAQRGENPLLGAACGLNPFAAREDMPEWEQVLRHPSIGMTNPYALFGLDLGLSIVTDPLTWFAPFGKFIKTIDKVPEGAPGKFFGHFKGLAGGNAPSLYWDVADLKNLWKKGKSGLSAIEAVTDKLPDVESLRGITRLMERGVTETLPLAQRKVLTEFIHELPPQIAAFAPLKEAITHRRALRRAAGGLTKRFTKTGLGGDVSRAWNWAFGRGLGPEELYLRELTPAVPAGGLRGAQEAVEPVAALVGPGTTRHTLARGFVGAERGELSGLAEEALTRKALAQTKPLGQEMVERGMLTIEEAGAVDPERWLHRPLSEQPRGLLTGGRKSSSLLAGGESPAQELRKLPLGLPAEKLIAAGIEPNPLLSVASLAYDVKVVGVMQDYVIPNMVGTFGVPISELLDRAGNLPAGWLKASTWANKLPKKQAWAAKTVRTSGEGLALSKPLREAFTKYAETLTNDETLTKLGHAFDRLMGLWKTMAVTTPRFYIRNLCMGNTMNMYEGGMSVLDIVRYHAKALPIARKKSGKMYNEFSTHGITHAFAGEIGPARGIHEAAKILPRHLQPKTPGALRRAVGAVEETAQGLAEFTEDWSRIAMGMWALDKGQGYAGAGRTVGKYLFHYRDLGKVEKGFSKRVFPFYTWMRKNIGLQFSQLANAPGRTSRIMKMGRAIEHAAVPPEERMPAELRPQWLAGLGGIQVRGGPQALMLNPSWPLEEFTTALDPVKWFSRAGPLPKAVLGIPGFETFPRPHIAQEPYWQRLARNVAPVYSHYGRPFLEPREGRLGMDLLSLLGGVKLYPVDVERERQRVLKARVEALEQQLRARTRTGGGR